MPSKSQAQFGKMEALFKAGKISKETRDEFNAGVDPKSLPARVGPPKPAGSPRSVEDLHSIYKRRFGVAK